MASRLPTPHRSLPQANVEVTVDSLVAGFEKLIRWGAGFGCSDRRGRALYGKAPLTARFGHSPSPAVIGREPSRRDVPPIALSTS